MFLYFLFVGIFLIIISQIYVDHITLNFLKLEVQQSLTAIITPFFLGADIIISGLSGLQKWEMLKLDPLHGLMLIVTGLGIIISMRISIGQFLVFTNQSSKLKDCWRWTRGYTALFVKVYGFLFLIFTTLGIVGWIALELLPHSIFVKTLIFEAVTSLTFLWTQLVYIVLIRRVMLEKS